MKNYDNFFLPVDNMQEAIEYYENLGLEMKFNFQDKGMVAYKVGSEESAIILKDKNMYLNLKNTIWFEVENTIEEYIKLKNKGIKFLSEPFKIGTGTSVEFEDPFGNRFGITDYKK